ncbi:hypothetical protein [Nocardioides lijunqiniae]|uniref:hypothetical protein n=1 Tax=Nocardioides lijunqiniae TaxID=2760832 RepID=UPI001877F659|nr:hypothetical protein [Nocardioides lijunqiniae]
MTSAQPPEPGPLVAAPVRRPTVALRVAVTHGDTTRRVDIELAGTQSVAVEDGVSTTFPTDRLWPTIRDLLPPVGHLQDEPQGRPAPEPRQPGPGFVEACEASVVIATVVGEGDRLGSVVVRSWLATADELWSVEQHGDGSTTLRPQAPGAVADLVIWDVTGAMEALVRSLEDAS